LGNFKAENFGTASASNNNRTDNNSSRRSGGTFALLVRRSWVCVALTAPGDRRHYGNGITLFDGGGVFLQVTNVLIVEVNVNEGAKLAVVGIEVAAEIGMLVYEGGEGVGYRTSLHLDRRLLPGILA